MWARGQFACAVLCVGAGFTSSTAHAVSNEVKELTLRDCIDYALLENLNLHVRRYDPPIASQEVDIASSEFDVNLNAEGNFSGSRSAAASSELEGSDQPMTDRRSANVALAKKFDTGTDVRLVVSTMEVDTDSSFSTLNPAIDSGVYVGASQPLLKNRGRLVNRANIVRAEISVAQADERLRAVALDLVRNVEFAYWALALSLETREVAQMAITLSEQLLAEATARFEKGINTETDVVQAEADLASKQELVLVSQQAIDDARDQLMTLMNTLHEDGDTAIQTEPIPEELPPRPEVDRAYDVALHRQPEILLLLQERQARELDRDVARQQHRPTLDLEGLVGSAGRDDTRSDAYDGMLNGDGYDWQVSLLLNVPWGLRSEAADERQSGYRLIQTDLEIRSAELALLRDVRTQCRAVWTGIERVGATRRARDMHELHLEQERARFRAGLVTVRNVMDAQDDANEARLRALVAIRATIEAAVQLARLEGSLLDAHGIEWRTNEDVMTPVPE